MKYKFNEKNSTEPFAQVSKKEKILSHYFFRKLSLYTKFWKTDNQMNTPNFINSRFSTSMNTT